MLPSSSGCDQRVLALASPAFAEVVEIPFSGILSSDSGNYSVGEAFSGGITYDREPYEDGTTYPFGIDFTFKVGILQYVPEVT
jgi:hypothetical protein